MIGDMVKPTLADTKTNTRRAVRFPAFVENPEFNSWQDGFPEGRRAIFLGSHSEEFFSVKCPYGQIGDRLWVRETWAGANTEDGPAILYRANNHRRYLMHEDAFLEADPTARGGRCFDYSKTGRVDFSAWAGDLEGEDKGWKPSIHMPRWASRITLEIVDIRIERVQDISDEDSMAEGIIHSKWKWDCFETPDGHILYRSPAQAFKELWDSINSDRGLSWAVNPWAWVIVFKRLPELNLCS
ncbi:MAG: hypothetical protein B9S32_13715 [Verrucomicrobia bacterium Tous-C9LFEB]|nr:MAG: hypothetical protein B9S32_13715 [Verrucomicrobia bacterium Tous-C9LFEB]